MRGWRHKKKHHKQWRHYGPASSPHPPYRLPTSPLPLGNYPPPSLAHHHHHYQPQPPRHLNVRRMSGADWNVRTQGLQVFELPTHSFHLPLHHPHTIHTKTLRPGSFLPSYQQPVLQSPPDTPPPFLGMGSWGNGSGELEEDAEIVGILSAADTRAKEEEEEKEEAKEKLEREETLGGLYGLLKKKRKRMPIIDEEEEEEEEEEKEEARAAAKLAAWEAWEDVLLRPPAKKKTTEELEEEEKEEIDEWGPPTRTHE